MVLFPFCLFYYSLVVYPIFIFVYTISHFLLCRYLTHIYTIYSFTADVRGPVEVITIFIQHT